jgi:hypothetical protein
MLESTSHDRDVIRFPLYWKIIAKHKVNQFYYSLQEE